MQRCTCSAFSTPTEGRAWCDYRHLKTITLAEVLHSSLRSMDARQRATRAAHVITDILPNSFPAKLGLNETLPREAENPALGADHRPDRRSTGAGQPLTQGLWACWMHADPIRQPVIGRTTAINSPTALHPSLARAQPDTRMLRHRRPTGGKRHPALPGQKGHGGRCSGCTCGVVHAARRRGIHWPATGRGCESPGAGSAAPACLVAGSAEADAGGSLPIPRRPACAVA